MGITTMTARVVCTAAVRRIDTKISVTYLHMYLLRHIFASLKFN